MQQMIMSGRVLGRPLQFALDFLVLVIAFVGAYLLRFEFEPPSEMIYQGSLQLFFVVPVQFAVLLAFGTYQFIWRYVGLRELWSYLRAFGTATGLLLAVRLLAPDFLQLVRVPISIIAMDAVLGCGGILTLRFARRALYERYEKNPQKGTPATARVKPVLLVGAGQAGVLAAKEIAGRTDLHIAVKGFLDDDPAKKGAVIQGIRVLGPTAEVGYWVRQLGIDHVILTIAHASRADISRIVSLCNDAGVKVRIIPGLFELLDGRVSASRIRDIDIEDILGREPVRLDDTEIRRFLSGKRVLVTGAGGSIGSELARQVARLAPEALVLVERAEFALFAIHHELSERFPDRAIVPCVADAGDEPRMRVLFDRYRPQVVVHAAAHKHVPMMEKNPCEAVKNNILATEVSARLAGEFAAEAFVLISTDKAVKPTSVMGASKRVAELVCQALSKQYSTRYVAVRFGNVLGSTGSVIPIFREQIARGGPVTVTHPDMVRYFMTIPEAAQLVLEAGAMGKGGEIFFLDMGQPVRILDLAKEMIRLAGLKLGEDIEIVFTGPRPGEKLSESLRNSDEVQAVTPHPKILAVQLNSVCPERVWEGVRRLAELACSGDNRAVRVALSELVPEAQLQG